MKDKLLSKFIHGLFCLVCMLLVSASTAFARDNSPEEQQQITEETYLRKVNFECGTQLLLKYDSVSLIKQNEDIRQDLTGGGNECNEPLRYLWYFCKDDKGRNAVKAAQLSNLVCKGTGAKAGSLTVSNGTITVERAFGEKKPFERSKKEFETFFKTRLQVANDDPYYDRKWSELKSKPNPVTDTKTYCMVNGKKVEWKSHNQGVADSFVRRNEDATVKCWKDGELITSLTISKGMKAGYETYFGDGFMSRSNYLDGKKEGEQRTTTNGVLTETVMYEKGKKQWQSKYYPKSGKLSSRGGGKSGSISLSEDGKLQNLICTPESCNDKEFRKLCGCDGEVTHQIYHGSDKVSRVVTFVDGKQHGVERVIDWKTGKMEASTAWDRGVKDGKELEYADDGTRVSRETIWKAGEPQQVTEFYLNGNPKMRATIGREKRDIQRFWDTGKVSAEETLVLYGTVSNNSWCKDEVEKTYYEDGTPKSVLSWKRDKRNSTSEHRWKNGRQSKVEDYDNGKLTKRKTWDEDGKLKLDEEYESDGSRKLTP